MKNFLLAARPKTLLASLIPPLVSYTYFFKINQTHEWYYLVLCLTGALFIQLATNFFNDVIDFKKGADQNRVGPVRVSASGLVDIKIVQRWAYICVVCALLCGLPLIIRGGPVFLVLGLISIYLTYGYTGGKISLAYRGLGELFVFIFFGLFSVLGSYYLFSLKLDEGIVTLAIIMGLLTTTFICINNLRDRVTDLSVGKRTLATKMSEKNYKLFTLATIFIPYPLIFSFSELIRNIIFILPFFMGLKLSRIVLYNKGESLNEGLKFSAIHLVIFSLTISVSLFL